MTRTRHRIDVAGAVLVLLAAGALIFGLLQGGVAWAWRSAPSIAVFAVAAVATVAAAVVESRAAEPIVPPWFWRRRVLAGSGLAAVGLGLLVIGPTTFLPTYGQAVLGLGAVAAGAVLATMSIGWPAASWVSGRFFLRLGFRDTELIGAGICLAATVFFLLTMSDGQVWAPVVSTFVLGFGLGLISVCTLVGPQSTVTWEQRGVITGTVMFCRFLGQSVGAAIFGAIFNAALAARLRAAPAGLAARLPRHVDQVGPALTRPAELGRAAAAYLRSAITAATHDVYVRLALAAVVTLAGVAVIVPRRFATTAGATASTGPSGLAGQPEQSGVASASTRAGPAGQAGQPEQTGAAGPVPSSGEKSG